MYYLMKCDIGGSECVYIVCKKNRGDDFMYIKEVMYDEHNWYRKDDCILYVDHELTDKDKSFKKLRERYFLEIL